MMDDEVQSSDGAESRNRKMLRRRLAVLDEAIAPARPLRIVDIGANQINEPSYHDLLELGGCEVWGFEPEPEAFAKLVETARPGTHYTQAAVGKPGPATFYHHWHSGFGSTFPVRYESIAYYGQEKWLPQTDKTTALELVSLDSLPNDELPKPEVVKIDIQGGELDVFRHGREKMSDAICVIPEVRFYRIYEGEPMLGDVDLELREQGFALHKFEFTKSVRVASSQAHRLKNIGARSQLLDGDAVYIRDPETIHDWTDFQVSSLAYAATGIFRSHDLALFALDELVGRGLVPEDLPSRYVDTLPPWLLKKG